MLESTAVRLAIVLACAVGTLSCCGFSKKRPTDTLTVIVSPQSADAQIGDTIQFTAEVAGSDNHSVTWSIQESGGGTVDQTGKYTAPGTVGYYHVVAAAVADPNVTASAAVTVRSIAAPVRYVGVNLMWQAPWDETQMFADIFTQSIWADSYDGQSGATLIGPDQWPASGSFRVCGIGASNAIASRAFHNGTYRVTFKGQANLQPRLFINYYLANTTTLYSPAAAYDPSTNTTVLDAVVTDGGAENESDLITLDVADADRNGWPDGDVGKSRKDGLTEMHMWRPGTYDSQTSQPTSHFNSAFLEKTQQFSLIRLMQTFGHAGDGVAYSFLANWSDRPLPGIMYWHQGIPYEEAILLANLTGKDVWINIPLHASDEFIRNVALTFAFGSDRSTGLPFTGAYGSKNNPNNPRPATHDPSTWTISTHDWFPPLAAGRRVYIEWSNEIWNYNSWTDETWAPSALVAATASVAAGDPWRIAWDGTTDTGVLMHRLAMAKAIQIGLEFRRAFGDAACNDSRKDPSTVRVRNVFAYQSYGVSSVDTIAGTSNWIEAARDYFDHVWGTDSTEQSLGPAGYQFSNRPGGVVKPDAYYLWGASSGGYLGFDNVGKCTSIDDALNWTRRAWDGYKLDGTAVDASGGVNDKQARGYGNAPYKYSMKAEHDWWWQRGIRFSLYEANHALGATGSNSYEQSAAEDPRLANVLLSATSYLYTLPGFDAWVHFSLTKNYCWGVTPTLYSTGTYVGKTYTTELAVGANP